jgi:hypothetical protein
MPPAPEEPPLLPEEPLLPEGTPPLPKETPPDAAGAPAPPCEVEPPAPPADWPDDPPDGAGAVGCPPDPVDVVGTGLGVWKPVRWSLDEHPLANKPNGPSPSPANKKNRLTLSARHTNLCTFAMKSLPLAVMLPATASAQRRAERLSGQPASVRMFAAQRQEAVSLVDVVVGLRNPSL